MNQRFRVLQEFGEQFEHAIDSGRDRHERVSRRQGASLNRLPGALAIGFTVAVTITIALVALLLIRPAHHGPTPDSAGNEASLLAQYAVLRRPQTSADRTEAGSPPNLNRGTTFGAGQGPTPGHPTLHYSVHVTGLAQLHDVPELTRVVNVDGVRVSLFVEHLVPSYTLPKATVTGNDPKGAASEITPQRLKMMEREANAQAGYYLIARVGRSGRGRVIAAPPLSLTGARAKRLAAQMLGRRGVVTASLPGPGGKIVAVVPDGVARMSWIWPREFDSETLTFVAPVTVSAAVRDNIAVAAAPARFASAEQIGPETVVRYAGDGSLLGRFTNPSNSASVYQGITYSGQIPGPETAQSRRAERDPVTPNRVVITPSVTTLRAVKVGPLPEFFFKVLLNRRNYFVRLTGGSHTGCIKANPRDSAGLGYGTIDQPPGQQVVRGDTYQGSVPGGVINCTGTYRLSIAVLGGHHPYPPFGSATFTVR